MTRSTWKGPFYEEYLLKKADDVRKSGKTNQVIKIWTRKSTILPEFVGLTFGVHNGIKFIPVSINENMVGHKFGEFSPTRTFNSHSAVSKSEAKPTSITPVGTIIDKKVTGQPADIKPKEESKEKKKINILQQDQVW